METPDTRVLQDTDKTDVRLSRYISVAPVRVQTKHVVAARFLFTVMLERSSKTQTWTTTGGD